MAYKLITRYELTTEIRAIGSITAPAPPVLTRLIELTCSGPLQVTIQFSTEFDTWSRPWVGIIGNADPLRPELWVYLPLSEYAYYYDMLRQERPVYFDYAVDGGGGIVPSGTITTFQMVTLREPTGEGNRDHSPMLSLPLFSLDRTSIASGAAAEMAARLALPSDS